MSSSILYQQKIAPEFIGQTIRRLRSSPMGSSSHGHEKYKGMTIGEAATIQANEFLNLAKNTNAAVDLMMVVLAANRDFKKHVLTQISRVRDEWPDLSLRQLCGWFLTKDYKDFKSIWGHADEKKYQTLKSIVTAILDSSSGFDEGLTDRERFVHWANNAQLDSRKLDPIGKLRNVGIATFQHLRMVFGQDTVKPDQRVMEVLGREFGLTVTTITAIDAVVEIAAIVGLRVIEVDQILVKYGSGYYSKADDSPKEKECLALAISSKYPKE